MEKFSKIIVLTIIGLSAAGALYVCCSHTLSHRSRTAESTYLPSHPSPEVRRARLVFAGDLMQHTPPAHRSAYAGRRFRFQCLFRLGAGALPCGRCSDRQSRNHPFRIRTYTGYPCFRSPAALAEALDSLGVDITVLANNHCCDGGSKGIRTTIRELDRHGIEHTGVSGQLGFPGEASAPFRSGRHTFRPAELHLRYERSSGPFRLSVNPIDTVRIAADLAAVEHDGVDCVIACMHWGNEYERRPNKVQRQLAGFCEDTGSI